MITKRALLTLAVFIISLGLQAQQQQGNTKFSPEKFDADLRQFIAREAHLSQQEAAAFFPLYTEMQKKQRAIFDKQRALGMEKPDDQQACQRIIIERDKMDIELKQIQQTYHKRFLKVLSPSKVYDVLKAESRFHRRAMKNWGQRKKQGTHNGKQWRNK